MLARGKNPFQPVITAGRTTKRQLIPHYLFRRELSGLTFRKPNASTIKKYETEIKRINANSSLSAGFKYRNSVRLFAMLDSANTYFEIKALHAKGKAGAVIFQHDVKALKKQQALDETFDRFIAQAGELFRAGRPLYRQQAHLQWVVFELTVFAPWEDVGYEERALRVPIFVLQIFGTTVVRILNRMGMWAASGAKK